MKIEIGNKVAFNKLDDAVWFDVIGKEGFTLEIRESGTDYATQKMDVSLVKQVKE